MRTHVSTEQRTAIWSSSSGAGRKAALGMTRRSSPRRSGGILRCSSGSMIKAALGTNSPARQSSGKATPTLFCPGSGIVAALGARACTARRRSAATLSSSIGSAPRIVPSTTTCPRPPRKGETSTCWNGSGPRTAAGTKGCASRLRQRGAWRPCSGSRPTGVPGTRGHARQRRGQTASTFCSGHGNRAVPGTRGHAVGQPG
mmetsp:Transcript_27173/g.79189  ORF Transcript_27173/g.79189 Transcript_27173/m.79189 type:complete len:201 (-) Transcript_27173:482-1084(-)